MKETRKSIDECSAEEWSAAAKGQWDFLKQDKEEDIFDGNLFDEADQSNADPIYRQIEEEERFEQLVQILGPYYAISYCHGAALDILLNIDNAHNSMSIDAAKIHLNRMARLIDETEGVNW